MGLIEQGINKKIISVDEECRYITYLYENKRRNFTNPEELVQAETYLKLIFIYNYNPKRIKQFVPVTMGATVKEADIIVYNDDACSQPHIIIECKKEEASELEFSQAVNQAFAYAYALAGTSKYIWVTSKIKNEYYQIDKDKDVRNSEADIPQFGVTELAEFKYAKGGGTHKGQKLFDLEIVSEDELTKRFRLAHQALWGGGELNPSEAFDELDKLIFCKIWDERKARKKGDPYDFQIFKKGSEEKTNSSLLDRIKAIYEEGRKKDPEVFRDGIRLSSAKCRTVVGYLENINLSKTDLDCKGRAFETFLGSFFRGDFGQFFTPRPVVKFIVDVLNITHNSKVLDTSCGSGGFLLHALNKVREEADLYYPDEIGDDNKPEGRNHFAHWHNFAKNNLFGIEINEQIARTAKMNMIIHDDGHTNVVTADGLISDVDLQNKTNNRDFQYNSFDFILTNPPFGSIIKQTERAYIHQYGFAMKEVDWLNPNSKSSLRESQSTEVLFIEQSYNYLREGGYLAIVVPDGLLTNSSMQYVRDAIEEMYRIVAVVSLPQAAFISTGAGVKSSVLFLKKHYYETTQRIKIQKEKLKDSIKQNRKFYQKLRELETEKKMHIAELRDFKNPEGLKGTELKKSQAYSEWKNGITEYFNEKICDLKESLTEEYFESKQKVIDDYSIFMAIAEEIGYDAAGKPTPVNELVDIGKELSRFIRSIEEGIE
ncbi:type I restriction-modification system DNA methylase subunit [Anaerosolibacter carboniphilus]|uniref:Type I restriction-modification system DNA methylase subunit n=1 Tax=Anaerosolibacter carboniphilus TaxID=1417629 RepID=A0A841KMQ2_9FIRM|nr:N-6 DNA methylase [Anaerosolibacter carboniphilus]MBB6214541.1 type I restriction-modification system DNA methylase subunit [Anaerosolibacter carboniphilus]